jgi:hypothetical protein
LIAKPSTVPYILYRHKQNTHCLPGVLNIRARSIWLLVLYTHSGTRVTLQLKLLPAYSISIHSVNTAVSGAPAYILGAKAYKESKCSYLAKKNLTWKQTSIIKLQPILPNKEFNGISFSNKNCRNNLELFET